MKNFAVIALCAIPASVAVADEKEPHFDAYVTDHNGRLATGAVLLDGAPVITPSVRIFETDLGEETPNQADEPGFYSDVFTPEANLGFNILAPLQRWNYATNSFDIAAETMSIGLGFGVPGAPEVVTPAGFGITVPGFDFATADLTGMFDDHPDFRLDAPASDGLYLLALTLTTDTPGVTNSKPMFILFVQGEAAEAFVEDAEGYVETNMGSLPSPGAAALFAGFGAFAATRRRRA